MSAASVLPNLPLWARTWIENWPAGLTESSFRQRLLPLTLGEAHTLLRRNGRSKQAGDALGTDKATLDRLRSRLDAELAALGSGAFARLGCCSAKDTPLGVLTGSHVGSGADVLRLLTDGSRRIANDVRRALAHGFSTSVALREWRDIPWWSEFRCFLVAGRLAGISQYHVGQPMPAEALANRLAIRRSIETLVARVAGLWGNDSVVVDVAADGRGDAVLIELNPWGRATHAALYSWDALDFDGGMRVREVARPGPAPML